MSAYAICTIKGPYMMINTIAENGNTGDIPAGRMSPGLAFISAKNAKSIVNDFAQQITAGLNLPI